MVKYVIFNGFIETFKIYYKFFNYSISLFSDVIPKHELTFHFIKEYIIIVI